MNAVLVLSAVVFCKRFILIGWSIRVSCWPIVFYESLSDRSVRFSVIISDVCSLTARETTLYFINHVMIRTFTLFSLQCIACKAVIVRTFLLIEWSWWCEEVSELPAGCSDYSDRDLQWLRRSFDSCCALVRKKWYLELWRYRVLFSPFVFSAFVALFSA